MDLRYPIGRFEMPEQMTGAHLVAWIHEIEALPRLLNQLVKDLTEEQLEKTYRPDGWTVRQVIHHIADSHMNSFIRMKLALTEEEPTINTYEEKNWAQLQDSTLPPASSLQIIAGLHPRWVHLLKALDDEQLQKVFVYPNGKKISIEKAVGLYAWHGNHHIAHIKQALNA